MRFLTMRHTTDTYQLDNGEADTFVGPHRCWNLFEERNVDLANKAHSCNPGIKPIFTMDGAHRGQMSYGFLDWEQFFYYWGNSDPSFAYFMQAGFVVYEYDIPDHDVLSDKTQAVAPIHKYEPVSAYVFPEEVPPSFCHCCGYETTGYRWCYKCDCDQMATFTCSDDDEYND